MTSFLCNIINVFLCRKQVFFLFLTHLTLIFLRCFEQKIRIFPKIKNDCNDFKVLKQMILLKLMLVLWKKYKNYFLFEMKEKKYCVVIFFLSFSLVYKYVRKTVVQHKTIKRIKFVVWKQSGFFITFSMKACTFF
jgi:hypothetical protein